MGSSARTARALEARWLRCARCGGGTVRAGGGCVCEPHVAPSLCAVCWRWTGGNGCPNDADRHRWCTMASHRGPEVVPLHTYVGQRVRFDVPGSEDDGMLGTVTGTYSRSDGRIAVLWEDGEIPDYYTKDHYTGPHAFLVLG